MRNYFITTILLLFVAILMVGCGAENDAPTAPSISKGSVTPVGDPFAAALTGDANAAYLVYTPPGYDPSGPAYPVVYLLHGFGGNEYTWRYIFSATDAADLLLSEGKIEPMVIVMPNGNNPLGGTFYVNSAHLAVNNSEDHILGIIAEVEANYNVMTAPEGKAISGQSMGGYGAISIALNNPDTFGSISALAAPIAFWGTMPASDMYKGVQELLPMVLEETGYAAVLDTTANGNHAAWRNMMYPTASRRVTAMMFAMTAAFSPFNLMDPYMPTLLDSMVVGVDGNGNLIRQLIGLNLPLGVDGEIDMTTWTRWMEYDPLSRFVNGQAVNLAGIPLYLECGMDDDLGLNYANQTFATAYESAFGTAPDVYNIYDGFLGADGEEVEADHTAHTYERMKLMLQWHNEKFAQ